MKDSVFKRLPAYPVIGAAGLLLILVFAGIYISETGERTSAPPDLAAALPDASELGSDWTRGEAEKYERNNLFRYNNGEAELYLDLGFCNAVVCYYKTGGNEFEVSIFDQGNEKNARAVFEGFRPGNENAKIGTASLIWPGLCVFYQDRYFIKVICPGRNPSDESISAGLARLISARLPP